jgi:DNA-binding MarR family transcriptional regulator
MSSPNGDKSWRFVSNHTQVLLTIARDSGVTLRDVATMVGITERTAQRIVADLIESGYVKRERVGRRNRYVIDRSVKMRHPAQREHGIGELLDLLRLDDLPGAEPPSR